jgi:hypothetical protein
MYVLECVGPFDPDTGARTATRPLRWEFPRSGTKGPHRGQAQVFPGQLAAPEQAGVETGRGRQPHGAPSRAVFDFEVKLGKA